MKEKEIERGIRLTWSSLESHLKYTWEPPGRAEKTNGESRAFHKKCVKEYAEVINILANLL